MPPESSRVELSPPQVVVFVLVVIPAVGGFTHGVASIKLIVPRNALGVLEGAASVPP